MEASGLASASILAGPIEHIWSSVLPFLSASLPQTLLSDTEITGVFVGPSLLCPEKQSTQTDDSKALWSNSEVGLHRAANRGGFSSRGWPEEILLLRHRKSYLVKSTC